MKPILLCSLLFGFVAVAAEPTNAPTLSTNVVLVRPAVALTPMQSEYLGLKAASDSIQARLAREHKAANLTYWNNEIGKNQYLKQFTHLRAQQSLHIRRMNALAAFDPTLKELPAKIARAQSKLVKATNVVDEAAEAKRQAEVDEAVKKFRAEQAAKGETEK